MVNGEREVRVHSIIVHETQTGYAQGFREDAHSQLMGKIYLEDIIFSKQIQNEWSDNRLWYKLLNNQKIINPKKI
jgi:6-pyruvoyltetrahydropterin/6-carboxytetrahydropterin synthase